MAETKYGKYIITEPRPKREAAPWTPKHSPEQVTSVAGLDDEVLKGAFYVGGAWFWPRDSATLAKDESIEPHKHDHDEVLGQFGTNPEDPHDLCGELEVWLDDEKHIVTKSCLIFIPKGLKHGPIKLNRIDRPIFHFAIITGKKYF